MTDHEAEAVRAVAAAIQELYGEQTTWDAALNLADIAVRTARPHLAAAERERCAQLLEARAADAEFADGSAGDLLLRAFTGCDPATLVRAWRGAAALLREQP